MPMPDHRARYHRSTLFLLRVWYDAREENASGATDEGGGAQWHGRVQRAVSGEAHSFDGRAGLIAVLETMLDQDRLERPRGAKNASSDADLAGATTANAETQ